MGRGGPEPLHLQADRPQAGGGLGEGRHRLVRRGEDIQAETRQAVPVQ